MATPQGTIISIQMHKLLSWVKSNTRQRLPDDWVTAWIDERKTHGQPGGEQVYIETVHPSTYYTPIECRTDTETVEQPIGVQGGCTTRLRRRRLLEEGRRG